ncbi:oxidoreductase-like protein [Ophiostoma piceae UAMH 11346]|uniref:Oxidoreductase-like protein n=1 Tax=Ophiostoma piceae (strain UAMH 11346) TaxID=1262450 RepID=S3BQE2_OPHP1|nr:oxidoreductase-like protein [Ophiostoma piceae UAMH 11346]
MSGIKALDGYYLGLTAIITVAYQLVFFFIAYALKFDKLTDFAGGTNFIVLAVVTLALGSHGSGPSTRQLVASLFIIAWALRLSGFLLFRIMRTGTDDRFDDMRSRFLPFLGFWVFQMLWVWTVSLPVTIINAPSVHATTSFGGARDVIGAAMFAAGFACEAVADVQRFVFRQNRTSRADVCSAGLFAWSRHPNYFGEILLQFGIFTVVSTDAVGPSTAAVYSSILGPLLLTALLFFVSGMNLSERPAAAKRYAASHDAGDGNADAADGIHAWAAYKAYLDRTSILVPLPPVVYAPLPTWVKRTLLLEFPIYVFDPVKHGQ